MKLLYFIKYNMTGEGPIKPGRKPVSKESKAALKKFAKTVKSSRSTRTKKHSGGGHTPDHLSQVTGVEESWNLVNSLLNNSAPIDLGPPRQVGGKSKSRRYHSLSGGGEQSSGATFLPAQWNTPKAPLPRGNNPSQIEGAYGRINAVSGMDVNLSAFPGSSMQQTGGGKKLKKSKKTTKKATEEKPAKKAKKAKKTNSTKSTSLWAKIKSFF
jgi:hypothetical protein